MPLTPTSEIPTLSRDSYANATLGDVISEIWRGVGNNSTKSMCFLVLDGTPRDRNYLVKEFYRICFGVDGRVSLGRKHPQIFGLGGQTIDNYFKKSIVNFSRFAARGIQDSYIKTPEGFILGDVAAARAILMPSDMDFSPRYVLGTSNGRKDENITVMSTILLLAYLNESVGPNKEVHLNDFLENLFGNPASTSYSTMCSEITESVAPRLRLAGLITYESMDRAHGEKIAWGIAKDEDPLSAHNVSFIADNYSEGKIKLYRCTSGKVYDAIKNCGSEEPADSLGLAEKLGLARKTIQDTASLLAKVGLIVNKSGRRNKEMSSMTLLNKGAHFYNNYIRDILDGIGFLDAAKGDVSTMVFSAPADINWDFFMKEREKTIDEWIKDSEEFHDVCCTARLAHQNESPEIKAACRRRKK